MTSWIIIGVLFLYMMYSLYNAFSIYKQHTTALKAFKAEHPNAKLFDISKGWVVSSVAMCAICVLIAIFIENMHVEASKIVPYRALYMVIALIFISMIFTSLAGKRMWFCGDGFFFGDRFFKYKDVDRREPIGGIGSHSLHLVMKDSYSIQINKKMDDKIDNEMKLWKAKKKARSK